MSSSSSATLMDEFQAFVTRVKQLHMSRSAEDTTIENLSHDKGRRRYENATSPGDNINTENSLLPTTPNQTPATPQMAKSLDEQRLISRKNHLSNLTPSTTTTTNDMEMETGGDSDKEVTVKKEAVKTKIDGETKEMKKNIQVMVGIDEDLKMILEMDPEIVDLGVVEPKVMGLPPLSGR